jgi:hypothetical protein
MGLLQKWKVSGLTTDAAQKSRPFWALGSALRTGGTVARSLPSDERSELLGAASIYRSLREELDRYLLRSDKSAFEGAINFLTLFVAVSFGVDGQSWNWGHVRHQAQGLYGSMDDEVHNFIRYNVPLIESIDRQIKDFVAEIT